jgi:hypothetical protein
MNVEYRSKVFGQFYKKMTERAYSAEKATKAKSESTLRPSTFDILRFAFKFVSYEVLGFRSYAPLS